MMTRIVTGLFVLLMLASPVLAAPGTADIFTADYSSSLGNWSAEKGSSGRTQGRDAGAGPHGLDAFQVTWTPGAGVSEFYLGHNVELSDFSAGTSRFFRWFEYHASSNNYRAGDGGGMIIKRLLLGIAGDRMILNTNGTRDGSPDIQAIFDGTVSVLNMADFTKGTWHAIQVEVVFGTTPVIKVWIDNDTYASPSGSITNDPDTATEADNGYTDFGMYSNDSLDATGLVQIKDSAFRVATTFDSSWYDWLQNGDGGSSGGSVISPGTSFTGSVRIQ